MVRPFRERMKGVLLVLLGAEDVDPFVWRFLLLPISSVSTVNAVAVARATDGSHST